MGNTYEPDGALWLRTEKFGDDKDRVLVKSDGTGAYISGDLAYYLDKRERGFDLCVIMLGADHHGYVGRLMAMCEAFGDKPGRNLEILIGQMVNLVRDGQPLRMAKRAGTVVTIDDLVEAWVSTRAATRWCASLRLQHRPRPRPVDPAVQRQPRLLRPVRPRPGLLDPAQRRLTSASSPGRPPTSTRRCSPTSGRATCCGRWRSSRAWSPARRAARAAPGGALPGGDGGGLPRFYDVCRVLPQGDEEPTDLHRAPAGARRRHPHRVRPRARPARRLRARADVMR